MGLDMNILRISVPDLDTGRIYTRAEIDGVILDEEDIKEQMYCQLVPYCVKVRVTSQYYDMESIRRDYKLDKDAHIWGYFGDHISISNIDIPNEIIEKKYILEKTEEKYVCHSEDIRYWRKAYDIQSWFYENIHADSGVNVENTGYYLLSKKLLQKFNKRFPLDKVLAKYPTDESALFYWEWY